MSGIAEHNYPAFDAACLLLREFEWDIVSPHEEHIWVGARDATPEEWRQLLRSDLKLLMDCQGIILLPGWSRSKGAQLEFHVAKELGLAIRFLAGSQVIEIT